MERLLDVPLCIPPPPPPSLLLLFPLASGGVLELPWLPAPTDDEDEDEEEQCSEVYFFLGTRALKVAVLRLAEGLGLLLELAALPLLSEDRQLLGLSSPPPPPPPATLSPSRVRMSSRSGVAAAVVTEVTELTVPLPRGVLVSESECDEGGVMCLFGGDGDDEEEEDTCLVLEEEEEERVGASCCSGLLLLLLLLSLLLSGWPRFLPAALARVDGGEGRPPFFSGFMMASRRRRCP